MKNILSVILLLATSSVACAETVNATGKINEVAVYGSGMVLVYGPKFGATHCSGAHDAFRINENHPHIDRLLSLILAAKAMQKDIEVNAEVPATGCWAPTFEANHRLLVGK